MTHVWERSLIVAAILIVTVAAEESVSEQFSNDVNEARGRKRLFKFLFKVLTPMISSLSTILLVKTKIVLVGLFLAGIYFFGHKIWPGGFCGHSVISDEPPPYLTGGISGYHSLGPDILSSYPGPEVISNYPGPEALSSYHSSGPSNAYLPPSSDSVSSIPPSGVPYSSRRGKREVNPQEDGELLDNEMYWTDQLTDMAFQFLGVSTRACRKRFVCEFDFHARRNPLLLFATRALGRDIFHNYRDVGDERAKNYQHCGQIYAECGVPKRTPLRNNRRRTTTTTTTTEEPEVENAPFSGEQEDETANDSYNRVNLDDSAEQNDAREQLSEWESVRMGPLGKLIQRRSSAQRIRLRGN
ncbi:uncharacterized protein LOC129769329 [Toxorhynchites rutilus septentrionalis]|uniref:uncharacterized protein LOC129769329 n=1 Tax=Toxorhynchites rutilus septentrionalis TaxID=329112 RepID=UPI00247A447F|nr:uncharacterized protein LOC129769329 [Toxorhynchites rutilus septentrionalis]